jgi:hypothetical protein
MMNMGAFHNCSVMPGLVPGIHVFLAVAQDVDGRERRQVYAVSARQTALPGHDDVDRYA